MKKWLCIGLSMVLLAACDRAVKKPEPVNVEPAPAPRPTLKDKTDPAWNSYGIAVPLMALSPVEPEVAGNAQIPSVSDLYASLKPAVGNRAYMSTNRYEVEAPNRIAVRPLDESAVVAEGIPNPNELPTGEVRAVWKNPVTITAGPIACLNAIIIADSEPSIVVLDPANLQPIKRFPVKGLIVAFTGFNPDRAELSVLQADFHMVTYRFLNEAPPVSDPVGELIGPSAAALENIQEKTAKLLSSSEPVQFGRTNLFPIASEIDTTKPNLFRLTVDTDGVYRIYLDGIGDIPFLFILFNEAGENIFSNVEYAAEKVLEQNLEKTGVYYLVVSLFPGNQANQTLQGRTVKLVVKQK